MTPEEAKKYLARQKSYELTYHSGLHEKYWTCEIPSNRITALGRGDTIEEAVTEVKIMIDAINQKGNK